MNILYISTAITQKELEYQKKFLKQNIDENKAGMIESTIKFHGLILKGLSENNIKVEALSGRMITNLYKKIFWKRKKEVIDENLTYKYISSINIPGIKIIWNILAYIYNIISWFHKNKNEENIIIIDGAYVSILPIIARNKKNKKICIIADIYDYMTDVENNNGRNLKFFKKIIAKSYNKMDAYIFLTKNMNDVINKNKKPYMILEGLVDKTILNNQKKKYLKNNKKTLMYAGALNIKFGLDNLINAFIKYKNDDAELLIFGAGPYAKNIEKYAITDERIKFKGVVSNEEIVKYEQDSTLLINPRQNKEEFTKYSFPSKNMEYMVSGTPMLGVKLDGIPNEYYNYMYTMETGEENELLECIKTILDKSEKELDIKGNEAYEFVMKNKNNKEQVKKILKFISKVINKGENNENTLDS